MSFKNKLTDLIANSWQPIIFCIAGLTITSTMMFFKLGTLINGLSHPEIIYTTSTLSISQILDNPVNAPHKLLTFAVSNYSDSAFYLRSISALMGLIIVILFYYVVSRWYGRLETTIVTLLLISSSWLLHIARFATADISLALIISVIGYGIWIHTTKHSAFALFLGVVLAGLLFYTPGMLPFLVLGAIWQRKVIVNHIKHSGVSLLPSAILLVIVMLPAVNAIIKTPEVGREILGLPRQFPTVYNYLKNTVDVPVQIFIRGPADPTIWLGRFPLLDIFCSAMCVIGGYTYIKKRKLDRSKLLFGILIMGTLLIGLGGGVSIILLVAPVYFLVCAGIAYMLSQWLKVFPNNPLARGIGISLVCLVALTSGYYNFKQYFIAWPNAPATKQVFEKR